MANQNAPTPSMLEDIVAELVVELYQEWYNALSAEQKLETDALERLTNNASNTVYFIIQRFMDKFNKAAEQVNAQDSTN